MKLSCGIVMMEWFCCTLFWVCWESKMLGNLSAAFHACINVWRVHCLKDRWQASNIIWLPATCLTLYNCYTLPLSLPPSLPPCWYSTSCCCLLLCGHRNQLMMLRGFFVASFLTKLTLSDLHRLLCHFVAVELLGMGFLLHLL